MFSANHYVPILKGKEAEYSSIGLLTEAELEMVTPLFEIPPVPWDFINEEVSKTPEEHLTAAAAKLFKVLGASKSYFVDLYHMEPTQCANGMHCLSFLFDALLSYGATAIPVTGLERPNEYLVAMKDVLAKQSIGACIRLSAEDLSNMSVTSEKLDKLMADLGLSPQECDLVVDFEVVTKEQYGAFAISAPLLIQLIPHITSWRTLTVAASSFPLDLRDIEANTESMLQRTDWKLWKHIQQSQQVTRKPSFADYAISQCGIQPDVDPRIIRMSANLRYTLEDDWLVLKGRNTRKYGYEQFRDLCHELIDSGEYYGHDYSWGDNYIHECATNDGSTGNPMIWRKIGLTHHIAVVIGQLSNLSET